jgi:hypothetical protein
VTGKHIAYMIALFCACLWVIWIGSWPTAQGGRRLGHSSRFTQVCENIFFEVRPFIPVSALTGYLCDAYAKGTVGAFDNIMLVIQFVVWWVSRRTPDDRDRWKRRREKVTGRIVVLFNRLRVVPG